MQPENIINLPDGFDCESGVHTTKKDGIRYVVKIVRDDCAHVDDYFSVEDSDTEDFKLFIAQRRRAWERDEWCFVGVKVTAYFGGAELAGRSLWGIESDSDIAHFREISEDLAYDMQDEISNNLEKLADNINTFMTARKNKHG